MKYEECFQELKHASIAMEKPKEYFTDPPPLPPEDLEPATAANQNKNEINQMNQMMMQNRGGNLTDFLMFLGCAAFKDVNFVVVLS